jgi:hypothetical protein
MHHSCPLVLVGIGDQTYGLVAKSSSSPALPRRPHHSPSLSSSCGSGSTGKAWADQLGIVILRQAWLQENKVVITAARI